MSKMPDPVGKQVVFLDVDGKWRPLTVGERDSLSLPVTHILKALTNAQYGETTKTLHDYEHRFLPWTAIRSPRTLNVARNEGIYVQTWSHEATQYQIDKYEKDYGELHDALYEVPKGGRLPKEPGFAWKSRAAYTRDQGASQTSDFLSSDDLQPNSNDNGGVVPDVCKRMAAVGPSEADGSIQLEAHNLDGRIRVETLHPLLMKQPKRYERLLKVCGVFCRELFLAAPDDVVAVVPTLIDLDRDETFVTESDDWTGVHSSRGTARWWQYGLHNPPQFAAIVELRSSSQPIIVPIALESYGNISDDTIIEHYRVDKMAEFTNRNKGMDAAEFQKIYGDMSRHQVFADCGWDTKEIKRAIPKAKLTKSRECHQKYWRALAQRIAPVISKFEKSQAKILRIKDVTFESGFPTTSEVYHFPELKYQSAPGKRHFSTTCTFGDDRYHSLKVLWAAILSDSPTLVTTQPAEPFAVLRLADFDLLCADSRDMSSMVSTPPVAGTASKQRLAEHAEHTMDMMCDMLDTSEEVDEMDAITKHARVDGRPACQGTFECPEPVFEDTLYCEGHVQAFLPLLRSRRSDDTEPCWDHLTTHDLDLVEAIIDSPEDIWTMDTEFVNLRKPHSPVPREIGFASLKTGRKVYLARFRFKTKIIPTISNVEQGLPTSLTASGFMRPALERFDMSDTSVRKLPTTVRKDLENLGIKKKIILFYYAGLDADILGRVMSIDDDEVLHKKAELPDRPSNIHDFGRTFTRLFPHLNSYCLSYIHEVFNGINAARVWHTADADAMALAEMVQIVRRIPNAKDKIRECRMTPTKKMRK